MKPLIAFLLLTTSLFGQIAVTENDPSALVEGIVSSITGDLYALEDDIVIAGAEPLRLRRSYLSGKGANNGWSFFDYLWAEILPPIGIFQVSEPNGTILVYRCESAPSSKHKKKHKEYTFHPLDISRDALGMTNTARGRPSAQTHLKNQYVTLNDGQLTIHTPNGTQRKYRAAPDQKPMTLQGDAGVSLSIYTSVWYRLESEELPNGHKILYTWDKDNYIKRIRTTNSSESKTYAEAVIHLHGKLKEKEDHKYWSDADFHIDTSDGRTLHYEYSCEFGEPKHGGRWYLRKISTPDFPTESFQYDAKGAQRKTRMLSAIQFPHTRELHFRYTPRGDEDQQARVEEILAPVGTDATLHRTHHLSYDLGQKTSCVRDAENAPTHYHWNEHLRPTQIDRRDLSDNLYCSTVFRWNSYNGNLLGKALCDGQRIPLYATTYVYDDRNNILKEQFQGNLTGGKAHFSASSLDGNQFTGTLTLAETCETRFSYSDDGKNLLLRKEEPTGLVTTYEYLQGTDLPSAEFFYEYGQIRRRKFYEYNEDRILCKEIEDDGSSTHPYDLAQVTTRTIKEIHPRDQAPYIGMPHSIEEKYWDGQQERLLKKILFHYVQGGKIGKKEIYNADNQFCYSLSYEFDERGRLLKETNALGQTAESRYDELNNKIYHQSFDGRLTTHMTYDISNRLIESKEIGDDGNEQITRYTYDKRHHKISSTDPYGHETRYIYDSLNHCTAIHLPPIDNEHPVLHSTFDAAGREICRTDGKGNTTHTTYNAYGDPIHIEYPDGTQERYLYKDDGALRLHTNPKGLETRYTYDAFKRILRKTRLFEGQIVAEEQFLYKGSHLIASTDAEGTTTYYDYDGAGRKIAEICAGERIGYGYDPLGRQNEIRQGLLRTLTEYDLLDRPIEERKENLKGDLLFRELYAYDSAGNKIAITRFIDGGTSTEQMQYDPFQRLIATQDPLGNTTRILYDDRNHTKTTIDPLEQRTIETFNAHHLLQTLEKYTPGAELLLREDYHYDSNENLIRKITTLFNPQRSIETRWEYDSRNRLTTLIEAAGTPEQKTTHYTYTPTGKIETTTKPSGITITRTYDPLDHLSSQASSDGTIHYTYKHDRLGKLLTSTDLHRNQTLTRTYSRKGRLCTETLPNGLLLVNTYDLQGRRVCLTLPDHSTLVYWYDPLYLRAVQHYTALGDLLYTHHYITYDLAGNSLSQQLIGSLGCLIRRYDLAGRPTVLHSPQFTHTVDAYDPVGNLLQATIQGKPYTYTYDALYQLLSENDHTYRFDPLYNRLQKDQHLHTPNALNQLSEELSYDPDGNPTHLGSLHCTYDALDRLIAIDTGTAHIEFTYDSDHRRIAKTDGQSTQYFFYDGCNEIGSVVAGSLHELRVLGNTPQAEIGAAIAIELQGRIYAPLHDLYGNIAALVPRSPQQGSSEQYRYTAFGEETHLQASSPWRFSSKRTDSETGFVYFGRRYYIPTLGRWLTCDPLSFEAGPNLYAYVANAPLTHLDLYGLFSTEDAKQMGIGAVHGLGQFALGTGAFFGDVAWLASIPFQAAHYWTTGKGVMNPLSRSWNSWQQSQAHFQTSGDRWMHHLLPGDVNHPMYQASRGGVNQGLEMGLLLAGGTGLARGAIKGGMKAFKTIRGPYAASMTLPGARAASRAAVRISGREALNSSNGFLGHKGFELKNARYQKVRNHPMNILGRSYTGHALDQMQNRGFTPSLVERVIQSGVEVPNKVPGRVQFYDPANNISVVTENNKVVTVLHGSLNQ